MIPTIGLIVAVYACARLLQVPLEHSGVNGKQWWLLVIAIPAILVIGFCTLVLLTDSSAVSRMPELSR